MHENNLPDWWPYDKPYAIEDCLEGMKQLPDKCVDLIVTSPPYNANQEYERELTNDEYRKQIKNSEMIRGEDSNDDASNPRLDRNAPAPSRIPSYPPS